MKHILVIAEFVLEDMICEVHCEDEPIGNILGSVERVRDIFEDELLNVRFEVVGD